MAEILVALLTFFPWTTVIAKATSAAASLKHGIDAKEIRMRKEESFKASESSYN
jgi:hypothetical protein